MILLLAWWIEVSGYPVSPLRGGGATRSLYRLQAEGSAAAAAIPAKAGTTNGPPESGKKKTHIRLTLAVRACKRL
jgi:hypothetical protein